MSVPADDEPELPSPDLGARRGLGLVWAVPLAAVVLAAWLLYTGYHTRGPVVTIEFESAHGIEADKTAVVYRGVAVGKVRSVRLDEPLSKVLVEVELHAEMADALRSDTRFWIVRPRLSVAGVSGLETLLSGDYIAVHPGEGEPRKHFVALKDPPNLIYDEGLRIELTAAERGSIGVGSPLLYREIRVGEVLGVRLADDRKVHIDVFVQQRFQHLVTTTSRFWNVSGFAIEGSLSGVKVRTESIESMLIGGIAFHNPDEVERGKPVAEGASFPLYESVEAAAVGIAATIRFARADGLVAGTTKIRINGIDIGVVQRLSYRPDLSEVLAEAMFDPRFESLLNTGTQFWLVKPELSAAGASGFDTLLAGRYIAGQPGDGMPTRSFIALAGAPGLPADAAGLRLWLDAPRVGALAQGAPVTHRDVKVGSVQQVELDQDRQGILVDVHIDPAYVDLVDPDTRFWRRGRTAIDLTARGLDVSLPSVADLLAGGIEFQTPAYRRTANGVLPAERRRFHLYEDFGAANADGRLSTGADADAVLRVVLESDEQPALTRGAPVYFHGVAVGEVVRSWLNRAGQVRTELHIDASHRERVRADSRFWVSGGASVSIGTAGFEWHSGPLAGLLLGAISFDSDGGEPAASGQRFRLYPDRAAAFAGHATATRVELRADTLDGLASGAPVRHLGVEVGRVDGAELADGGGVRLLLSIDSAHAAKVGARTRFWRIAPVEFRAGLDGIELRTAVADTILRGGIEFADLAPSTSQTPAVYELFDDAEAAERGGTSIELRLALQSRIGPKAEIRYGGARVGRVQRLRLAGDALRAQVLLYDEAAHLARTGTRFREVSAEIGLGGVANLDTLITGAYLELVPGPGSPERRFVVGGADASGAQVGALHVLLEADRVGSVRVGNPVQYREIAVGAVEAVSLGDLGDRVVITARIDAPYVALVRENSRFWNVSGLDVEFGLVSGLKLRSGTLETIAAGGVAFATPGGAGTVKGEVEGAELPEQPGPQVAEGASFRLHERPEPEWLEWAPSIPLLIGEPVASDRRAASGAQAEQP